MKSTSLSPEVSLLDKFDINMPGTSKDIVVLTPSPNSNLSFVSDINMPGPSGLCQSVRSDSNRSASSFVFDIAKDLPPPRTPSVQSMRSSIGSDVSFEKPIVDLTDPKDSDISDMSPELDSDKCTRSVSEPCRAQLRSGSVQSQSSTTSAPCRTSGRTQNASKENKEVKATGERGRKKQKKAGAFQTYTAASKERDKESERQRSDSLSSVDSISHELSHFRPIQCSPRTARKKLADGSTESPPIVQATPRNLKDMKTPVDLISGSPFIDPPPLVRAKFEKLVEERHIQVEATSKATMTGVTIQHWKKIARPEARMVSTGTKRKLSQFEYSSSSSSASDAALMQPPKYQRVDVPGGKGKQRRTIGTQKTIPVKKRHIPVQVDMEISGSGGTETVHYAAVHQRISNPPKSWERKVHHDDVTNSSDHEHEKEKPKKIKMFEVIKPSSEDISNSGAKRKILIDDDDEVMTNDDDDQIMSEIVKNSGANAASIEKRLDPTPAAKTVQHDSSECDSLETNPVSSQDIETSPSKVYRMKLKVPKQGTAGSSKVVAPVISAKKIPTVQSPTQDVSKRKPASATAVFSRGSPQVQSQSPSLNRLRRRMPTTPALPSLPSLPAACTRVNASSTPVKQTVFTTSCNSPLPSTQSNINESPENHRRSLRSQRLRNGVSPGKGILVETIQNGSKKENTEVVTPTKQRKVPRDASPMRKTPQPNRTFDRTVTPTRTESPKLKRSPRIRRRLQSSSSPKVSSASPHSSAKSKRDHSPAPSLKSLKSPKTERRNTLWKYMELMTEEQKRLKQEEEDRRIALELQQEFDKQEKLNRNKVVRKKGSKDAYRLRHGSSSSVS